MFGQRDKFITKRLNLIRLKSWFFHILDPSVYRSPAHYSNEYHIEQIVKVVDFVDLGENDEELLITRLEHGLNYSFYKKSRKASIFVDIGHFNNFRSIAIRW